MSINMKWSDTVTLIICDWPLEQSLHPSSPGCAGRLFLTNGLCELDTFMTPQKIRAIIRITIGLDQKGMLRSGLVHRDASVGIVAHI